MADITIRANHKAIRSYRAELSELRDRFGVEHEGGLRVAFGNLLRGTAGRGSKWVNEMSVPGSRVRPDATLLNEYHLPQGHWEAKDSSDDLEVEIRNKRERDYPFDNIIFEDTRKAILYQDGRRVMRADCDSPTELARLLTTFYRHHMPDIDDFEKAVERFAGDVPEIARGLQGHIDEAHQKNATFQRAFAEFMTLCREALNPNISRSAVEEMLIQHLLTERLICRVFNQERFTRRNAIAAEVENVIDALTSQDFDRRAFLGQLDRFFTAIERAADRLADFSDKQRFINTVYERFFQGFSVRVADTHGIVYTPQEVVEFMVAATDELLLRELGLRLGDKNVRVIDPCTGTGNFVVQLLRRVARENRRELERFYRERLFANEVMLMPYYIASLNIEHEYHARSGRYEPFEGMCFVDTLDLAEGEMPEMFREFSQKNSARVERQKAAKINVVIGNPPYNVGQLNENDNNKNRKYKKIDDRIRETYVKDSRATKTKAYDAYVKFFRWASDLLNGRDGIVCFITNNSFVDVKSMDGLRKHLLEDFSLIYHLDLAGNFRKGKGEGGNVFGNVTGVGVGITLAVHNEKTKQKSLNYHRVSDNQETADKLASLAELNAARTGLLDKIAWQGLKPDAQHTWLLPINSEEYAHFIPLSSRAAGTNGNNSVFRVNSNGVSTNRDTVVYDFDVSNLQRRVRKFVEDYNAEVDRFKRQRPDLRGDELVEFIDEFVNYDIIKWSRDLKANLRRSRDAIYDASFTRQSMYRPFSKRALIFAKVIVDVPSRFPQIFPTPETERENLSLALSASSKEFHTLMTNALPDLHLTGDSKCFPLYTYDADGTNRRENITDWALTTFRDNHRDDSIEKLDIFHYVYGLLHHPGYRERHADSLRRELPRIPLAPDFHAFRDAGRELARLHLNYERERPWDLDWEIDHKRPTDYRVEKMRPLKRAPSEDGDYRIFDALEYNDTLTLRGIPAEAFRYRLGTRSALEWVIDQYRVKTDKRSGIVSDPNAWSDATCDDDNEQYIVNLLGRVITVSVETVKIVDGLAGLKIM